MILDQLKIPILQGPIGSIASPKLAAAVSNAGGMGSLALTWTPPDTTAKLLGQLKTQTSNPFFVNFVLAFPPNAFDTVVEVGVPAITFSWGHAPRLMQKAQAKGIAVGVQVGNLAGAKRAIRDGADFLICQGLEAGGHVQSTTELKTLLQQVRRFSPATPVIAAGGIATGQDIADTMQQGAKGVMMGTRFVATQESRAHLSYKESLVQASAGDTSYTLCFDGEWPQAAHRVLRNSTLTNWEADGCSPKGRRPGEGDVLATLPSGGTILRYDDTPPLKSMQGRLDEMCQYAGMGVGQMNDIPSVSTLLDRLWDDAQSYAHLGVGNPAINPPNIDGLQAN